MYNAKSLYINIGDLFFTYKVFNRILASLEANNVEPVKNISTLRAHSRPSLIAQTTKD